MKGRGTWTAALLLALAASGCSSGDSAGGNSPSTVGPNGGVVSTGDGVSITFPRYSLGADTTVRIDKSSEATPQGAVSSLYAFGPAGTVLGAKATVQIPVPAGVTAATIYWGKAGQAGQYDALPTAIVNQLATAHVPTLQSGFVGTSCMDGDACAPANPCHIGVAACSTGTMVCTEITPPVNLKDDVACGTAAVCMAGTCTPINTPVISAFTASPASINPGQSSTLAWTVTGADALSIDQGVGTVTGTTSKVVTPSNTVTYTLTATNAKGSTTQTVTVTVSGSSGGGAVTAVSLADVTVASGATVNIATAAGPPPTTITGGSAADLDWSVDDATSSTWPKAGSTRPTCSGSGTCGTITAQGVYTAPRVTTTTVFRARATSKANPSIGDYDNITVTP